MTSAQERFTNDPQTVGGSRSQVAIIFVPFRYQFHDAQGKTRGISRISQLRRRKEETYSSKMSVTEMESCRTENRFGDNIRTRSRGGRSRRQ